MTNDEMTNDEKANDEMTNDEMTNDEMTNDEKANDEMTNDEKANEWASCRNDPPLVIARRRQPPKQSPLGLGDCFAAFGGSQ